MDFIVNVNSKFRYERRQGRYLDKTNLKSKIMRQAAVQDKETQLEHTKTLAHTFTHNVCLEIKAPVELDPRCTFPTHVH